MKAYQKRMLVEQKELLCKIKRLQRFLLSEKGKTLPKEEREMLAIQGAHMLGYSAALELRLLRVKEQSKSH